VRELHNAIERAVIVARSGSLEFSFPNQSEPAIEVPGVASRAGVVTYEELRQRERDNLIAGLKETNWRISGPDGAAALLGLKPTTLASKMKAMKIQQSREEHRD
jgi:transcriptional regulator with GAF, ATPase, and Fis domain